MSDWSFFIGVAVFFCVAIWAAVTYQDSIPFLPISEYAFTIQMWGK